MTSNTITGLVEAATTKEGKYGFKINGEWYNGIGSTHPQKGQHVEVQYTINGKWKNVKVWKVLAQPSSSTMPPSQSDKSDPMWRASALKTAILGLEIMQASELLEDIPDKTDFEKLKYQIAEENLRWIKTGERPEWLKKIQGGQQ